MMIFEEPGEINKVVNLVPARRDIWSVNQSDLIEPGRPA